MLIVISKSHDRVARINQGLENRLVIRSERLEVHRRRFSRNMIHAQVHLRAEYKRLKDERFRNMTERNLIRHHDIGKSLQLEEVPTDGLLHCPGIQDRFSRKRNIRRTQLEKARESANALMTQQDSSDDVTSAKSSTSEEGQRSKEIENSEQRIGARTATVDFHPIPIPPRSSSPSSGGSEPVDKRLLLRSHTYSSGLHHHPIASSSGRPSFSQQTRSVSSKLIRRTSKCRSGTHLRQIQSASLPLPNYNNGLTKDYESEQRIDDNQQSSSNPKDGRVPLHERQRRHTAPLLSRLSMIKKQILEEEAEFIIRLRKQSQQIENEKITEKVWRFIGRRPVSVTIGSFSIDSSGL